MAKDRRMWAKVFGHHFEAAELCATRVAALANELLNRVPDLSSSLQVELNMDHEQVIRFLETKLHMFYYETSGNLFTTRNSIERSISLTDIGDEIPMKYIRPPFPCCFIEFGESRNHELKLYNQDSGEHVLEGVYIREITMTAEASYSEVTSSPSEEYKYEVVKGRQYRILDIMATGSPLGKKHVFDDTFWVHSILIEDENAPANHYINRLLCKYRDDPAWEHGYNYYSKVFFHIAKVLLFLGSNKFRQDVYKEKSLLLEKLSTQRSSKKRAKLKRRISNTYDRVIISPTFDVSEISEKTKSKSKKSPHWRRGHFRLQPYGKKSSLRKLIFIEPMLVGGSFSLKKDYLATENS